MTWVFLGVSGVCLLSQNIQHLLLLVWDWQLLLCSISLYDLTVRRSLRQLQSLLLELEYLPERVTLAYVQMVEVKFA